MKKLSLRLLSLASLVSKGSFVADVGSDHGALPIFLTNEGISPLTQAIENKKGPFSRLQKAVYEEASDPESILLSLSDGLSDLDPRMDTVVLAGMGGLLISSILEKHPEKLEKVKTLIIDAHKEKKEVLLTTAKLGFKVAEEIFIEEDGIFYSLWKLEKTAERIEYSETELLFGPYESHRKGEVWRRYMASEEKRLNNLLAKPLSPQRREEIVKTLSLLKESQDEH